MDDLVVVDLEGSIVEGDLRPSSDTPTHLLYINHSAYWWYCSYTFAMGNKWAQAGRPIPALGTTHADYFYGEIPCTRSLTKEEVDNAYELETGNVIIETFEKEGLDPVAMPGVLVAKHAPFCLG